jgi:hypothetical protein
MASYLPHLLFIPYSKRSRKKACFLTLDMALSPVVHAGVRVAGGGEQERLWVLCGVPLWRTYSGKSGGHGGAKRSSEQHMVFWFVFPKKSRVS